MINAVPTVRKMASYALADLGDPSAVSLAQNESAFPPSPKALAAGRTALQQAALYPDPDWRALRGAIAGVHPVAEEEILCGAGSMELVGAVIRAYAGPGDKVLGTQFGYLFVATATQQAGAQYVRAPEVNLQVDIDGILSMVDPATRIVFVCNPGNPTGTRIPNADIIRLRMYMHQDILLVVDQAYAEFDDQDHDPIFDLVRLGNTIITRTFSKAYGLAGARVGWGVFPPDVAAELRKLMNPNNISGAAQAMATAAMLDQSYMMKVVQDTTTIRHDFISRLSKAEIHTPPSFTNFVLLQFANAQTAATADSALRAAGVIMRPMGGYGLSDCLRATVGPPPAMDRAASVLEALI